MPDLVIKPAEKNAYFTYMQIDGKEAKFRELEQIWNHDGIVMRIQGSDGNRLNGFGKRHLLSTEKSDPTGAIKANSILTKRQGGKGATDRDRKLRAMVNDLNPASAYKNINGKPFDKEMRSADMKSTQGQLEKIYERTMYGPETDVCTFVFLNEFDGLEIRALFAQNIKNAGPWSLGQDKEVNFDLGRPAVFSLHKSGARTDFNGFRANVHYTDKYYDIYHMVQGI